MWRRRSSGATEADRYWSVAARWFLYVQRCRRNSWRLHSFWCQGEICVVRVVSMPCKWYKCKPVNILVLDIRKNSTISWSSPPPPYGLIFDFNCMMQCASSIPLTTIICVHRTARCLLPNRHPWKDARRTRTSSLQTRVPHQSEQCFFACERSSCAETGQLKAWAAEFSSFTGSRWGGLIQCRRRPFATVSWSAFTNDGGSQDARGKAGSTINTRVQSLNLAQSVANTGPWVSTHSTLSGCICCDWAVDCLAGVSLGCPAHTALGGPIVNHLYAFAMSLWGRTSVVIGPLGGTQGWGQGGNNKAYRCWLILGLMVGL